ncbi:mersacidin/lichenicidin family type 2 lantibiotic [Dictyobacter aurantiacus]|uniref:Mersacidin/lichenicidin family type 2 lantibiotic n=1 Tax=Dictyobacter aurantiacus TaxID=1936993 RepID=A0A401ZP97_9CHLR|nr:mersacidin/lichenicidin family type 2 lantibiotic [Dictyobacter aurantiacus]GCE08699.1 hypothetical protein KDAU_60280 [Dictyobacter aurantiacus]
MSSIDVVRAWTDEAYRRSLEPAELAQLPANPAGEIELIDADLAAICGGDGISLGIGIGIGVGMNRPHEQQFSLGCSADCLKSSYCFTFGPCC